MSNDMQGSAGASMRGASHGGQGTPSPHGHMGGHHGRRHSGEKAQDFKGTMLKLLKVLSAFKAALFVVLVFSIGSTVFNIIGPKVLSTATTELFDGLNAKIAGTGGVDFGAIGTILVITLAIYLVSAACSLVQSWVMTGVSQRLSYDLRRRISEKIDRMPFGYFESHATGDVLSRITNDVDTLGQGLSQFLSQFVVSLVTIVGVVVMMLTINVTMTLVAVLVLPVSVGIIMFIVKRTQKFFLNQQTNLGRVNAKVEETFSGHTVVKAFNRELAEIEDFNRINDDLYESAWKSQFFGGFMMPVMNLVANIGYVVVAVMGALFAVLGTITVGDIQAFIQYVKNFTQPVTQLSQVSTILQQVAASAERVFAFLEEPEVVDVEAKAVSGDVGTDVEFSHVRFGYDSAAPVIKDFSANVEAGQTVALVGPTGAGKTTMVKLLMRFYDVDAGSISVGGRDIRDFDRSDLRSMFGMVLQDTWLFNGTIRENIRYGRLDATDEEVEQAAKAAFAHHFITTLPHGYDTVINEDASNISQGQRQLLTIARAVLANRRMLILDEATSSVDTRTEERIQRAMDDLMVGRTSFVIAHRLSTIRKADLILVIRDGDIVEQGNHEELLAKGGFYADLYNSQFSETGSSLEPDAL